MKVNLGRTLCNSKIRTGKFRVWTLKCISWVVQEMIMSLGFAVSQPVLIKVFCGSILMVS